MKFSQTYPFKLIIASVDAALITLSLYCAYLIRFDFAVTGFFWKQMVSLLPVFLLIRISALYYTKSYQIIWKYTSVDDLVKVFKAILGGMVLLAVINYFRNYPLSLLLALGFFVSALFHRGFLHYLPRMRYRRLLAWTGALVSLLLLILGVLAYTIFSSAPVTVAEMPFGQYLQVLDFHGDSGMPRGVVIMEAILSFTLISGVRLGPRLVSELLKYRKKRRKRVLVFGAGEIGRRIVVTLKKQAELGYQPVGFVDDDPEKQPFSVYGVRVLGTRQDLPRLIDQLEIEELLVTPEDLSAKELQDIAALCWQKRVVVRRVPEITWRSDEFLPFALPSIDEEEIDEVVDAMRSGWLTTGPKVSQFESDFAEFTGAEHALAVNSATAGLHLSLEAIGVREGDRVITSPYTFTASAEVVRYLGADPVFVDIDPQTFNIDPLQLKQAIEQHRPKAILPVHFAGQACEMDAVLKAARGIDARVVEDAAHALPCLYKGQMVGTLGDLTVFSFYATKTVTTGEGGMVVTQDARIAERIRTMRLHGISRDVFDRYRSSKPSWYYEVVAPGFKYNLSDLAAAMGIHQLRKAEEFRRRREEIARKYTQAFAGFPVHTPQLAREEDLHAWHLYVIQLELEKLSIGRDQFIELMSKNGIGTSVHFIPLHIQPYWRDKYGFKPEDFPVALDVYRRAVSLPIYPRMTNADVERVIESVRSILTYYAL